MVKHNNVVPNGHFKKHWQNYVKTWFNQPARKTRRRIARQKKAVKIFPRPTAGPLRPIVQCQTLKYNMKSRSGRGFTLEELKVTAAGIPKKLAPTIGIAAGDSTPEELATATQVQGPYLPVVREKPSVELVKVTEEMKSFKAYAKLRVERMNQRQRPQGSRFAIPVDALFCSCRFLVSELGEILITALFRSLMFLLTAHGHCRFLALLLFLPSGPAIGR
ncbi:hypothetical protein GW17_00019487 [Ensete ventricosum]|nr:hypothetical protein GW17_00019487 [Ensete ventricosum]